MNDLTKEERLEQRIEELEQLIEAKCEEYSNKKWLRVKRTFFVLSGVIYLLLFWYLLEKGISIGDLIKIDINIKNIETILQLIFVLTFGVGFLAIAIMFISYGVLYYITENSIKEEMKIAKLEGELNAIESEKYNNLEDKKIKELKRQIEYLKNYQEKLIEENTHLKLNKVFKNDLE